MGAFGLAFCGEEAPELRDQVRVECCAECCPAWEAGRGDAIEEAGPAYAVWTVCCPDCWDAESGDCKGVPGVGTCVKAELGVLVRGKGGREEDGPESKETFSFRESSERIRSMFMAAMVISLPAGVIDRRCKWKSLRDSMGDYDFCPELYMTASMDTCRDGIR